MVTGESGQNGHNVPKLVKLVDKTELENATIHCQQMGEHPVLEKEMRSLIALLKNSVQVQIIHRFCSC